MSPTRGRWTSLPLAIAYIAVPLGTAATRFFPGNQQMAPMVPWLILAIIGAFIALSRPGSGSRGGTRLTGVLFFLSVAAVAVYAPDLTGFLLPYFPYIKELTPLIFLLFCGLWAITCGLPDRGDLQHYGGLLGLLMLADCAVESFVYQTVPTVRWLGNADVLAGMLLVSLCACVQTEKEEGRDRPGQDHTWRRGLIMAGLLACLSRTGLFAAAWVVLCFGRGKLLGRTAYAILCATMLVLSFFLPPTTSDAVRYTDYWLWIEAIRLTMENPALVFSGFPVATPLPIEFPPSISIIWETATGQSSFFGIHLTQIPSFWLRLFFAWGAGAPLFLLAFIFMLLSRRTTRMGAGLTAGLFAQGMMTPLLFDPAMAVSISFGYIIALASPVRDNPPAKHAPPQHPRPHPPTRN